jgi:transcriptional regulator with XRE-family HTH domain
MASGSVAPRVTMVDLAVHTGLARTYSSRLEHGKKEPCLGALEELATALEMKPWELIKGI